MISKEFQAILVKVAGAGLVPEKHLGEDDSIIKLI
jgi:hypothetical protein